MNGSINNDVLNNDSLNNDSVDNDPNRRNARLSIKLACCDRDSRIAAALFTDFKNILSARFPCALTLSRQYDSEHYYGDVETDARTDEELMRMTPGDWRRFNGGVSADRKETGKK